MSDSTHFIGREGGREWLGATCRMTLGVVFILAGWAKLGHASEFALVLANYKLLPRAVELPLALGVPGLELTTGLALLLGVFVRLAAACALVMSIGFAALVTSALARGLNIECGCFAGASTVSFWHLGLDLGLLTLAVGLIRFGPDRWALQGRPWWAGKKPRVGMASLLLVVGALPTLVFGLPGSTAPLPALQTSAPPTLIFDPPSLELGDVQPGQKVTRTVTYRNSGDQPLNIAWVQSSCGCTVAQPEKRRLAVGESGRLTVEYKAREPGESIRQTIRVYQRGRQVPAVLQVSGKVCPN